ncbi:MAG TPA: hypothetical protein PKY27_03530 [Arachnia sp.]|nr:hypothetical protein [Propionibacteriaceae bacterium]HQD21305.1 hypothetical protein [Arachnia sp.]
MSGLLTLFLILLGLAAAGFAVWAFLRHRYVSALQAKGWSFLGSPDISITHGLNVPPFGVGFDRSVKDQVVGAAGDGTPFASFDYRSDAWRGTVAVVPLPHSMPPAELTAVAVGVPGRIHVDHASLVMLGARKDADELQADVDALAQARRELLASSHARLTGPPPPTHLAFHDHPDWTYLPQDDRYLDLVEYTEGGSDHEAVNIITGDGNGLPFVRLTHKWTTTRTSTDANGHTSTHTDHHSEDLCEFRTTFRFGDIACNWGLFGRSQKFEWEEFNKRVRVNARDQKFASDVIHQRQMEFLLKAGAPSFRIAQGRIQVGGRDDWMPDDIDLALRFLHGFFGRVPDFVWQGLGAWPRPIAEIEPPAR